MDAFCSSVAQGFMSFFPKINLIFNNSCTWFTTDVCSTSVLPCLYVSLISLLPFTVFSLFGSLLICVIILPFWPKYPWKTHFNFCGLPFLKRGHTKLSMYQIQYYLMPLSFFFSSSALAGMKVRKTSPASLSTNNNVSVNSNLNTQTFISFHVG